jgi:EAL domain-containing protein (putative c-di-GMP-specific phosphodiesterase class I)
MGADLIQGYSVARPMPVDDLARWITAHQEAPEHPALDNLTT